jgi:hypothetical protein
VTRHVLGAAALAHLLEARAVLVDQRLHPIAIGAEVRAAGIDVRVKTVHHQPQQSVLNRHDGQRHTACMRYMSAPQRSHFIASSAGAAGECFNAEMTGVTILGGTGLREGSSTPAL